MGLTLQRTQYGWSAQDLLTKLEKGPRGSNCFQETFVHPKIELRSTDGIQNCPTPRSNSHLATSQRLPKQASRCWSSKSAGQGPILTLTSSSYVTLGKLSKLFGLVSSSVKWELRVSTTLQGAWRNQVLRYL